MSKEILALIEKMIANATEKLSIEICKELVVIKNEFQAKGLLSSGEFVTKITDHLRNKFIDAADNLLFEVENAQSEWNVVYETKELEAIDRLLKDRFQKLLLSTVIENYEKNIKYASGDTQNLMWEMDKKNLEANISTKINTKIKEIGLKNKVTKDNPSIRQAKIANIISLAALVLSLISLYFAAIKQ